MLSYWKVCNIVGNVCFNLQYGGVNFGANSVAESHVLYLWFKVFGNGWNDIVLFSDIWWKHGYIATKLFVVLFYALCCSGEIVSFTMKRFHLLLKFVQLLFAVLEIFTRFLNHFRNCCQYWFTWGGGTHYGIIIWGNVLIGDEFVFFIGGYDEE